MKVLSIHCPGGKTSQSGAAVTIRYPGADILSCTLKSVPTLINENNGLYAIPIWNSNAGEISASEYVWDMIEESSIQIVDIWPQEIEFWYVTRTEKHPKHNKIGSVSVAGIQCRTFIQKTKAEFIAYPLTTDAMEDFKNGAALDGVLVAPGQGENEEGLKVTNKGTANNNNFTSFATITKDAHHLAAISQSSSWLTGVTMASLTGPALSDGQASFFEQVFQGSYKLKEIPKLIFVFKRVDRVGLLFEGEKFSPGDFLDAEELEAGDITIHEDAGKLETAYTTSVDSIVTSKFPALKSNDFILHLGVNTVLFSCPALGMYTHGFEKEIVEPVVRLYIDNIFKFIDDGGECSVEQKAFFERHKTSWNKARSKFMTFKAVS